MTSTREANRLRAVAIAEAWGIADTAPAPLPTGIVRFKRIGTARHIGHGGVTRYGVYGFAGVAEADPCAYAAWEGEESSTAGEPSKPARACLPGWTGLTWFTHYEPAAAVPPVACRIAACDCHTVTS
jgi:hypothetical protein